MIGKKGDQHNVLIILLISLLVLGIMLGFMYAIKNFTEKETPEEICEMSVTIKARSMILGKDTGFADLNCPTIIDDRTKSNSFNFLKGKESKDEVMKALATKMYSCWNKYGRGEIDFISDSSQQEGKVHCFICEKTYFSKDVEAPTFKEFAIYLNTKKIPGKTETFAEFFQNMDNTYLNILQGNSDFEKKMDLNKPLYTTYRVVKIDSDDYQDYLKEKEKQSKDNIVYGEGLGEGDYVLIGGEFESGAETIATAATAALVAATLVKAGAAAAIIPGAGWAVSLVSFTLAGGVTAYYSYFEAGGDAELPIYSLGVYSAEDIKGVCNFLD
jgi:hypothetical protein